MRCTFVFAPLWFWSLVPQNSVYRFVAVSFLFCSHWDTHLTYIHVLLVGSVGAYVFRCGCLRVVCGLSETSHVTHCQLFVHSHPGCSMHQCSLAAGRACDFGARAPSCVLSWLSCRSTVQVVLCCTVCGVNSFSLSLPRELLHVRDAALRSRQKRRNISNDTANEQHAFWGLVLNIIPHGHDLASFRCTVVVPKVCPCCFICVI